MALAGGTGGGKTSSLVPLFANCTHLTTDLEMHPRLRRRVVYVAEDTTQVLRILAAMKADGYIAADKVEEFDEWFVVVTSARLDAAEVAKYAEDAAGLAEVHTRIGPDGRTYVYSAQSLLILDTTNANLDLTDENSNSEVGKAMAKLNEGYKTHDTPCVLVGHTPKVFTRSSVANDVSMRGAGAFTGDTRQTVLLVPDDTHGESNNYRWLAVDGQKHRFSSPYAGVEFEGRTVLVPTVNELGEVRDEAVTYGRPRRVTREERVEHQQAAQERQVDAKLDRAEAVILEHLLRLEDPSAGTAAWNRANKTALTADLACEAASKRSLETALERLVQDGVVLQYGKAQSRAAYAERFPEGPPLNPNWCGHFALNRGPWAGEPDDEPETPLYLRVRAGVVLERRP